MIEETSQITEFFKNQTVFLTGGSGFLGKVLIEKLLRECPDLRRIYVLMRPKKGKTPEQRFEELFNYPCFDRLKTQNIGALQKIFLVNGDCQEHFLGLSDQNRDMLKKETTCVMNAAANVKFDQRLKEAACNVRATRDLLELAKQMPNLRTFVHISTAYCHCFADVIKEQFYEPPLKAEPLFTMISAIDDDTLEAMTPSLLGKWPNTYVYTKSITEDLVKEYSKDLPLSIVRPAIVCAAKDEPMPGWIDNFYGLVGVVTASALGIIRSLHCKLNAKAYVVPVDFVGNCVLAAAWWREKSNGTDVYNYVGDMEKLVTWESFAQIIEPICWSAATEKVIWYYCMQLRENQLWHKICVFFLHTVVSYIVDFVLFCCGKPTLAVQNYRRLDKMMDLLSYFSARDWNFENESVKKLWNEMNDKDKKIFDFNMKNIDWISYYHVSVFGAREYLLKDTIDTLPKGQRKLKILCVLHYTIVALFYFLMYKLLRFIFSFFW